LPKKEPEAGKKKVSNLKRNRRGERKTVQKKGEKGHKEDDGKKFEGRAREDQFIKKNCVGGGEKGWQECKKRETLEPQGEKNEG